MSDWYVGQRVCCIAGRSFFRQGRLETWLRSMWKTRGRCPTKGEIFEISGIFPDNGIVYLTLSEIPVNIGWGSAGFRPLVESKNDISELTAILDRVNAGEVTQDEIKELCPDLTRGA